ncbi:MAG: calcium/sodium antiporter [Gemmatimonadales bacterium]|jgi:cation:H+ antiporter
MLLAVLELVAGLIVLAVGGHGLVRGATVMALLARVPPMVVGLTVVAMGTSLPELAVSVDAAARNSTDLAFGNIIGSCVFNIGAILGTTAVIAAVPVQRQTIRYEYPAMVLVAAVVVMLARDGMVERIDGGFLVVGLAFFIAYTVFLANRGIPVGEAQAVERDVQRAAHLEEGAGRAWGRNVVLVLFGLGGLVAGAELVVAGAIEIAVGLGVEERVVGLTIIAMGTSLPELATCVAATRQGESEIAIGNVVGSNIFNLLAILGITAVIFPVPVHPRAMATDNWVMLAFAAVVLPMMLRGRRISRWNGLFLLLGFATYMGYVIVVR